MGRTAKSLGMAMLDGSFDSTVSGHKEAHEIWESQVGKDFGEVPECPDWIEDYAKQEWNRIVPIMARAGMIQGVDLSILTSYCQAYARWRDAEEFVTRYGPITKTKSGYWQMVPQVIISHQQAQLMLKCTDKLGLTPTARGAIRLNGADSQDDPLEAILQGGEA